MNVTGECHCGNIAYEAIVDPATSSICNCTDCQQLSGSPFRASGTAKAEGFHITRGQPKIYVKTAESGNKRAQGFCGDCGSPIFATTVENRAKYNLRLGTVRQRADLPPKRQIWCESAISWGQNVSGVPGLPRE